MRPMSAWQPPEAFDEYRVVRLLGEGAMGVVYLARDTVLDRSVAIKFLPAVEDEPMLHARFLVEGRAIARLQHPNVVAIYRVGSVDGRPYLVSEFAHGETLKDMRKPIPWSEALRIGLGLCRGLAAAHRRGVLHRDIKPANAILTDDGEAKLVDFGLAKLLDTAVGEMLPAAAHPARARASLSEASSSESTILAISPDDAAARTVVTAPPAAALEDETASMSPRTGEAAPPPEVTPSGALTRTGAIVGTPLYMAPEVWLSKPSTRASDVYSLGAVLYELCTGRPPHRGRTLAELAYLVQTDDPPSVADLVPDIDPRFAAAIHRCLRRDAALRFASADELRETLEAIADPGRVGTRAPANPYRGLEAFEAEHRAFFFGRERELAALLDRVRAQSLVVVAGDSGVGKSSLCRAGVLPEILEGALRDGRKYLALTLVPGRRPLETLSAMLATETGSPTASATEVDPAEAIARRLREYCRPGHGVILFIDQLEELVTVASQADAEAFASLLDTLEVTAPGVRVLATVRADFLSRLSPLGHLGEGLSRAVHILGPLAPWETREAIVGPARLLGVRFDPPELIDQLLDAYAKSEGGLPLLQFALAELWEARDRDRGVIPFEALARIGGLDGALSRHADGVVAKLLPAERAAARRMLSALVTPESTRRPRRESELEASPEAKVARDALVRGRLVLARESEGETSFELAHDALIRSWGTLRAWLDEDGERQAAQERLAAAAASWERLGRPDDALWARSQLDEMRRLGIQSREAESGFLAASARAVLRRRFVRAGLALALPVLVFAIYAVVRGVDKRQREAELTAHLADARTRLDGLRQKNVWLVDRRRQALAAFDASAADAETRWQDVLREDETEWREYASLGQSLDLMFLDHPRHPDVRRELAAVTFDRILLAEADHRDIERKELVSRLELFDGNGEVRKRLQEPARIQLRIAPHDARVKLLRYEQHDQRLVAVEVGMVHEEELSLAPGSYLLLAESAGRAPVRMPVLLRRGEHRTLSVELPDARAVPEGFVFIPAGSFLYGSAEEGDIRRFLESEPMHEVQTAAYLIGQHEVTYAEWLAHVEALPAAQRQHMTPLAKVVRGELRLDRSSGLWRVAMRPAAVLLEAREGTPIVYPGRQKLRSHDWRRMPVGGITLDMARRYAAWLAKSGKVPGARLCSEHEWERAARGADDRTFPHGYQLTPADGNHDASYDFKPDAMGPDEVGSHPASRSPFGLDDMAGNVYEWVDVKGKSMVRGGAYYYNAFTARVDNRGTADPSMAEVTVGTRICASFSPR